MTNEIEVCAAGIGEWAVGVLPPLTRLPREDSTRKLWLLAVLSAVALGGGGCATSGPNHIYFTADADAAIHDLGPSGKDLVHCVAPGERVLGLAYDFNTDHLFLRIAPAQVIRVIERPSGKILREMPLSLDNSPADEVVGTNTGLAAASNGARSVTSADLAIRSSDRHLFGAHPDGRSVVELTLFGDFVRRIELSGLPAPIGGLAYDQKNDRLLVLTAGNPAQVGAFTPGGNVIHYMTIAEAVVPVSLGYDSGAQHFFVPLADGQTLGEFDSAGALVNKITVGKGAPITALDAGPRSFVRVF